MDTTNPYAQYGLEDYAAFASPNEQTAFTRRSLFALTLAVMFQIVVLALVFWVVSAEQIVDFISRGGRFSWLAAVGHYLAYAICIEEVTSLNPHRLPYKHGSSWLTSGNQLDLGAIVCAVRPRSIRRSQQQLPSIRRRSCLVECRFTRSLAA